jgi:hypothetical protein
MRKIVSTPAHDDLRFFRGDEIDEEAVEFFDFEAFFAGQGGTDELEPFLDREQRSLPLARRGGHDHFIEQTQGSLDHIDMAERDRIEAAGVNGAGHEEIFSQIRRVCQNAATGQRQLRSDQLVVAATFLAKPRLTAARTN